METRTRQTQALALEAPFATIPALAALLTLALATTANAVPRPMIVDYFPLHEGDRRVFVVDGNWITHPSEDTQVIRVTDSRDENGHKMFEVSNYAFSLGASPTWFTVSHDSPATVMESNGLDLGIWYEFAPGRDIGLPTFASDCIHGSKGSVIGLSNVLTPAGAFPNCLEIRYVSSPCDKTGLVSESFAPGIGLVQRQILSLDGVLQTWSLAFALINGQSIGSSQSAGAGGERGLTASPARNASWGSIKAAYGN